MPENQPDKKSTVLITGGSGLVGRYLTSALLTEGYKVCHLSRKQNQFGRVRVFRWDPVRLVIDPVVLEGVDYIIHLAGANIGEKRWTNRRREEIIKSRVESAGLIYRTIAEHKIPLKAFISASGISYYGLVTSDKIFTEDDPPAKDFLGNTCRLWEESADQFRNLGIRTVRIRTALVLEKYEGILRKIFIPLKLGFAVKMGSGHQYMPWIHIKDLCNIYLKAIEDQNFTGSYNAVAPHHVNHNDFMRTIAAVMKRPLLLPPIPGMFLRVFLGEMSELVLKGSRVSPEKIIKAGYQFVFDNLQVALREIINSPE